MYHLNTNDGRRVYLSVVANSELHCRGRFAWKTARPAICGTLHVCWVHQLSRFFSNCDFLTQVERSKRFSNIWPQKCHPPPPQKASRSFLGTDSKSLANAILESFGDALRKRKKGFPTAVWLATRTLQSLLSSIPCLFVFRFSLLWGGAVPFFSKNFRGSAKRKKPCFLRDFKCFCSKKARVGGSGLEGQGYEEKKKSVPTAVCLAMGMFAAEIAAICDCDFWCSRVVCAHRPLNGPFLEWAVSPFPTSMGRFPECLNGPFSLSKVPYKTSHLFQSRKSSENVP